MDPLDPAAPRTRIAAETPWYELFSRGARDWLRHNDKVREAVTGNLPELLSGADILTQPTGRTVLVPVKLLEHSRFRLREALTHEQEGLAEYRKLLAIVAGRNILLEEYARAQIAAEEAHAAEIGKMLRKPGSIT